jgi:hypothetical protein
MNEKRQYSELRGDERRNMDVPMAPPKESSMGTLLADNLARIAEINSRLEAILETLAGPAPERKDNCMVKPCGIVGIIGMTADQSNRAFATLSQIERVVGVN